MIESDSTAIWEEVALFMYWAHWKEEYPLNRCYGCHTRITAAKPLLEPHQIWLFTYFYYYCLHPPTKAHRPHYLTAVKMRVNEYEVPSVSDTAPPAVQKLEHSTIKNKPSIKSLLDSIKPPSSSYQSIAIQIELQYFSYHWKRLLQPHWISLAYTLPRTCFLSSLKILTIKQKMPRRQVNTGPESSRHLLKLEFLWGFY